MSRRSIAILLSMALCLPMLSSTFAAAEETEDLNLNQDVEVTNQVEYQMAVEKTAQMESHGTEAQEDGMTPIEEYKEEFDKRAAMPSEILSGMGYSDEEIAMLESYRKGEIPFETAAIATEAALASSLVCTTHSSDRYIVQYTWEWDKTPLGLGEDSFSMGLYGINASSVGIVTKLNSASLTVRYYYTDGTYYKIEAPSKTTSANSVSASFDSYKQDSTGSRWVWAKKGTLIMNISPAVNGVALAAVRAAGEYGHSDKRTATVNVSVSVNMLTGTITMSYSVAPSSASVKIHGRKQYIFYNDGTVHVES